MSKIRIDFSLLPKPVEEWPIRKEDLGHFSNANEILTNLNGRLNTQTDISKEKASHIDIQSPEALTKNIKNTLAFHKSLNDRTQAIYTSIEKLASIEPNTKWQYGFFLEQHIPVLRERITSLKTRIKDNYIASTTHKKLSSHEEQVINNERKCIMDELKKFEEDIREYI